MIYKVIFSFKQESPRGGNGSWKKVIKLYDAENAIELQSKIDKFLSDDECGYRKFISVKNISRL